MYLALVLSDESKERILKILEDQYEFKLLEDEVLHCSHCTLYYNPKFEVLKTLVNEYADLYKISVVGIHYDNLAMCLRCYVQDESKSIDGRIFHVTVKTKQYVSPVYSNTLMQSLTAEYIMLEFPIILNGSVQFCK